MVQLSMTAAATGMLILVRHGQSSWNKSNQFTGWMDVPLTAGGAEDAQRAARLVAESGIRVDVCYTSALSRSIETAHIMCDAMQQDPKSQGRKAIPIVERYRLNERHYGCLTGLAKRDAYKQVAKQLAEEDELAAADLLAWRTTLDGKPPPLQSESPYYEQIVSACDADVMLSEGLTLPLTESIRDCCARVEPLWRDELRPRIINQGQTVMVVGHANNLRALIRCVQGLDDEELSRLGVPNGLPLVYEFLTSGRPLPDPRAVGLVPPLTGRYLGMDAVWFERLDQDESGTLNAEELSAVGLCSLEDGSCTLLLESIDNNSDGRVDFNEFVAWTRRMADNDLPQTD